MAETAKSIIVTIRNSEAIVFHDSVRALSSFNEKGPFDVLPMHSNFISIISKKIILHQLNGQRKEIPIDSAVLRAAHNEVNVFLGIGFSASQVEVQPGAIPLGNNPLYPTAPTSPAPGGAAPVIPPQK